MKARYIVPIIIVVIAGYYFLSSKPTSKSAFLPSTASSTSPVVHVPFTFSDFSKGEISLDKVSKFTEPTTKDVVSFKLLTDQAHQATNPTYGIYVNGVSIGEVGGQGATMIGFSPDNKYFALRSRFTSGCAGTCQDFLIYVVDLEKDKVITIKPPRQEGDTNTVTVLSNYIESYSWDGDGLKITFFVVGSDKNGIYRVSPKEIWHYDFASGKYTLTQTLPATASQSPFNVTTIPDWNTCDYSSSGFKFQYPKDWVVYGASKAQGGGDEGLFAITCGKSDPSSFLFISLSPRANSNNAEQGSMRIIIVDISRDNNSDAEKARSSLVYAGGAAYNGRTYTVSFAADTSSTTKDAILSTFEFVPQ